MDKRQYTIKQLNECCIKLNEIINNLAVCPQLKKEAEDLRGHFLKEYEWWTEDKNFN